MIPPIPIPTLQRIQEAQDRIRNTVIRTPVVPLWADDEDTEIFLKLENLQPIGSFKLRGATNAIRSAAPEQLENGVYTASAGNMAQGVAWSARELGVKCSVVVPESAPRTKLEAIRRLGGTVIPVSYDEWWDVMTTHRFANLDGFFVHPVAQADVVAGNGTVGLEIAEDLPDVEAVVVPYGGGGLSSGIAAAFRGLGREVKVFGAESESATPLAAAFEAGKPVSVTRTPSFIDGIGASSVLPEMWPMVSELLAGSIVVSVEQIEDAIYRLMQRQHVIAEGAGGAALAAGLTGKTGARKVVCVISGGNIDLDVLERIVQRKSGG